MDCMYFLFVFIIFLILIYYDCVVYISLTKIISLVAYKGSKDIYISSLNNCEVKESGEHFD